METAAEDERFGLLLEVSPDAIVVVDDAGVVRRLNAAAEALFGWPAAAIVGEPVEVLLPERLRAHHVEDRSAFGAVGRRRRMGDVGTLVACRRDGTEFPVDIALTPVDTAAGRFVVAAVRDMTAQQSMEVFLRSAALEDPLTGLGNRRLFADRLGQAHTRAGRHDGRLAVLVVDLDRFKAVNDTYGHDVGDRVLVEAAQRLRATVREADTLCRVGGEEFAVLCEDLSGPADSLYVGDRLLAALRAPYQVGDNTIYTTASVGAAFDVDPVGRPEALMQEADVALYRAKARGRGRVELFDSRLRSETTDALAFKRGLRDALYTDELTVLYQPIVTVDTSRTVAVEAYARWRHPDRGLLPAAAFVDIAKESGLIVPLGRHVLYSACTDAQQWRRDHLDHPELADLLLVVNVDTRELQSGFAAAVANVLATTDTEPRLLAFDLPQDILVDLSAPAVSVVNDLHQLGVRLILDDVGVGLSPLTSITNLPLDMVEIDRSIATNLDNPQRRAIAEAVVHAARSLGLPVIAEGIETAQQLNQARLIGCDLAQGNLFGTTAPTPRLNR